MPKNYGTYSDPLDVPRKKDVDAVASEVANKYSATNPPPYPVKSVNSKTGAVTLGASDVGALPLSGGTMTGVLTAQSNTGYGTAQVRNEKLLPKTDFDAVTDWTSQLGNGGIAWCYE